MGSKKNDKNINIIIRPIDKKKFAGNDDKIKMLKEIADIVRKYGGLLRTKDNDIEVGWF